MQIEHCHYEAFDDVESYFLEMTCVQFWIIGSSHLCKWLCVLSQSRTLKDDDRKHIHCRHNLSLINEVFCYQA